MLNFHIHTYKSFDASIPRCLGSISAPDSSESSIGIAAKFITSL